jgi:hypothetical protein
MMNLAKPHWKLIFLLLLLSNVAFSAKKKKTHTAPKRADVHQTSYKISHPIALTQLDADQKAHFDRARTGGGLVQGNPVSCACNVNTFYFCLYKKKGDSLESLKPLVEKSNQSARAAECDPNSGCRAGWTDLYFYCD